MVYAHLAVGGLGVAALGWRAGWPLSASVLAAVIFMFGGPAAGRLQHSGIIISYGLFPVALLLMKVALRAPVHRHRRRLRHGGRGAGAGSQPRSLAAVLRAGRTPRRRDLLGRRQVALSARAGGRVDDDGGGELAAGGGATTADRTVCRAFQSTRGAPRQGTGGLALSGQPGVAGSGQRAGLAGEHASLLGAQPRHPARGRRHRSLLQLSFRRCRLDHCRAVVRHRLRRPTAARQQGHGGCAAGGAALCAGPLHAGLCAGVRICAGHQSVSPADRRHIRAGRRIRPARRPTARRLRARRHSPRRAVAACRRGRGGARHRRVGRAVLAHLQPRVVVVMGGCEGRPAGAARHRGAGARRYGPDAHAGRGVRDGAGDRRAHLVQRGVEPQCREPRLLLGAAGPDGHRRAGARRARARARNPAQAGRAAAGRGRRRQRLLAEPRHGARPRGDQRLQPAAHRLLRSPGLSRRNHPHRRPAAVSGLLRRLRLRARPRAGPRIPRARPADRGCAAPARAGPSRTCCWPGRRCGSTG